MKQYKFELIVNEQSDEFFEMITDNNKSGCDELLTTIKELLEENGWDIEIKLTGYNQ